MRMVISQTLKNHREIVSLCKEIQHATYVQQPFLSAHHFRLCVDAARGVLERRFGECENPDVKYEQIAKNCEDWMLPPSFPPYYMFFLTWITTFVGILASKYYNLIIGIVLIVVMFVVAKHLYFCIIFDMPRVVHQYIDVLQTAATIKYYDKYYTRTS